MSFFPPYELKIVLVSKNNALYQREMKPRQMLGQFLQRKSLPYLHVSFKSPFVIKLLIRRCTISRFYRVLKTTARTNAFCKISRQFVKVLTFCLRFPLQLNSTKYNIRAIEGGRNRTIKGTSYKASSWSCYLPDITRTITIKRVR
jgi:hypothetical protein